MNREELDRLLEGELARRSAGHQRRTRQVVEAVGGAQIEIGGRRYVNFASNDYLGLSRHPRVIGAVAGALGTGKGGSGASALVTGYSPQVAQAEAAIARWKGSESAVLLPSGYQAAHAAVQTLAGMARFHSGGVRFLADKLAHASLIDAMLASQVPYRIFPHNYLAKLERLLSDAPPEQIQVVLTESIFSMDGDAADLRGLAELKRRRPFVLLLDDAHGSGVYGEDGAGYAAELALSSIVDISIVTFSKALGLVGGAVCGSRVFCDALINWGRAYIYSTAVPPAIAAGVTESLHVMREEPWRRKRVRQLAMRVRRALREGRASLGSAGASPSLSDGDSPIIPVIYGSDQRAIEVAERLREAGLYVAAIRPPTVPRGSSRIRITLSSEHSDEDVERLLAELLKLRA